MLRAIPFEIPADDIKYAEGGLQEIWVGVVPGKNMLGARGVIEICHRNIYTIMYFPIGMVATITLST